MSVNLEKATAHFKDKLSGNMKSVEIPEWECTLYFKPVSSLAVEQKVIQLHSEGKMVEALVESLIAKACDADGKKAFTNASKTTLMNEVDPEVLMRVVGEMNNATTDDDGDLGN